MKINFFYFIFWIFWWGFCRGEECETENRNTCGLDNIIESPPIINIAALHNLQESNSYSFNETIIQLGDAAVKWGFFHVTSHGLESSLDEILSATHQFFNLPSHEKLRIKRTPNNSRGFADDELTKQRRDLKQIFDVGRTIYDNLQDDAPENIVLDGHNQYPSEEALPGFRKLINRYYVNCSKLSRLILGALSLYLQLPFNEFDNNFSDESSFLRLNYYPKDIEVEDDSSLGISRHTDAGALTLLLQDEVSGLEVYSGKKEDSGDGEWVPVHPVTGAFTVNIGDMVQVWSNNKFHAAEHRVRRSTSKERYSIAFFYNPNYDAVIQPCPRLLREGERVEYRPINWGEFRSNRFKGDFADYGRETQIDDYALHN